MTVSGMDLRLLVPLLALGGCGGTSAVMDMLAALDMAAPPDLASAPDLETAPDLGRPDPFHWSCYGKPWPSTAPDPITVGGTVVELPSRAAVPFAKVQLLARGDDHEIATTTSDESGAYKAEVATKNVALDHYKKITTDGFIDSYEFPPFALFSNQPTIAIYALTAGDVSEIGNAAKVLIDETKAQVGIMALDCDGTAVDGAQIKVNPPGGKIVYVNAQGAPAPELQATTSDGRAIAFNVPPSASVDITVTAWGRTFRRWTIKTFAGAVSFSPRHP